MKDISQTLDNRVADKRDLEYNKVTKLLESKRESTREIKSHRATIKKLLDNIEVSYVDFEKKNHNDNRPKIDKKKVTFKPVKPQQAHNTLTRQKSNFYTVLEAKRLSKQPSPNMLTRTKSKK